MKQSKDVHILIHRMCECTRVYGKGK
jgi:hypothetical protein